MCEEYKDGGTLAFIDKENNMMYRKVGFIGGNHATAVMFPLSTKFETKVYNIDEISIHGKVVQVIMDIG